MQVQVELPRLNRIFVYDDNAQEVRLRSRFLRLGGFEIVDVDRAGSLDELACRVVNSADAALCDHVLHNSAPYYGAELVARWYSMGFPAVLMTSYFNTHCDTTIRRYRHHIPVVLEKEECKATVVQQALRVCWDETHARVIPSRRPIRTLVQLLQVEDDGNEEIAIARIPSWDISQEVRFPLSLVPPHVRSVLTPRDFCIARVNTGATRAEDLFFNDFEAAPEAVPESYFV